MELINDHFIKNISIHHSHLGDNDGIGALALKGIGAKTF
jgi:hypothetical protein